ncbi:ABC-type transporter, periplasmic subunit family 3 [Pseudonocardia dioxanivorans CB1190]|uniref:ABC-type transporter, periplasmic subunit family 3 n=1 Tax=Pseudonocardia dioxanivorans (strain ATCC 55486 / DSM 44775 / JCM 13855 / CB1190) TaxID=675635 RepID=F4CLM0_PSEUX|nr:ABC-type transporter, periplasmic subunit family 3 [Pseudonocardia dioxanivorans CB1190]
MSSPRQTTAVRRSPVSGDGRDSDYRRSRGPGGSGPRWARIAAAGVATVVLGATAAACGGSAPAATGRTEGTTSVTIGALSNGAAKETALQVPVVESIRNEVPRSVPDSGTLVIGSGSLPTGSPPLGFVGTDQKTLTGSEPDLGRLVAAVLGLEPRIDNATWANLFVGIDSGRTDVGFSNITDTEQRKEKYDFACYRQDNLGFETLASSPWNFDGTAASLAGRTVSVGKGTNQEKILLQWQSELQTQGKTLDVKYFPDINSTYLALSSGKIDAYFLPNPSVAYHVTQTAGTPTPTRSAGKYSGAGASLQGLICATTKKGNGLAEPVADAINHLIQNGQYAAWLDTWNLANEAVPTAQINPPGLPLSNS